jgi:hypothetical protein
MAEVKPGEEKKEIFGKDLREIPQNGHPFSVFAVEHFY